MKTSLLRIRVCVAGALLVATWAGSLAAQPPSPSGTVLTIVGNGSPGYSGDGGPATAAMLNNPYGLAIGPGGSIYFPDATNFRIRKIDLATLEISTVAGDGTYADIFGGDSGDGGQATSAQITEVESVAIDPTRDALYFGDQSNNKVRKVDLATGIITRYAGTGIFGFGDGGDGGPAENAQLATPRGVGTDSAGRLSIANIASSNNRVRQVDPVTGIITTIADSSDGIFGPNKVSADAAGNVYVLNQDGSDSVVHRVDAMTGVVTLVAGGGANNPNSGSGPATSMDLDVATDLAEHGDILFIAAGSNNQIWQVDLASGLLSVYAGTGTAGYSGDGGPATGAQFFDPHGITVTPAGEVIVSDTTNHRVRYIVPESINLVGSDQTELRLPWISSLSGDFIVTDNANLSLIDAPFLSAISGNMIVTGNASAVGTGLGSVTTVSGSVNVNDNTSATGVDLGSLQSAGAVSVNGNTAATGIDLSDLLSSDGPVSVNGNTAATVIDVNSLESAGAVSVNGNTSATGIDLSALLSSDGAVNVNDNTSAMGVDLGSLESAGAVSVNGNTAATVIDVNSLESAGSVSVNGNTAAMGIDLSALLSSDGAVSVNGNTSATVIDLGALETSGGSVEVSGNTSVLTINLPSLTTVGGNVTITNNASATDVNLGSLMSAGASVSVSNNGAAGSVDLSSLATAGGSVTVSGNGAAGSVDLSALTTAGGDVSVSNNGAAGSVDLGSLVTVDGSVTVSGNGAAGSVDLGALTTAGGDVSVSNNGAAGSVDLSSLATADGSVTVSGNGAAGSVDLGSLTTAGGSVSVSDNGSATSVDLGSLAGVGGDLTVETAGGGTFDVDGADVEGDTSLSTTGYTEVDAATAAGETALTMINGEATMELVLPDGAFAVDDPVTFSVEQLAGDPVETWGENAITTLAEYQFNFEIATIDMEATLNFEIDLAVMDAAARMALLDLLHANMPLTLAVEGDDPGAALEVFDVCGTGETPSAGGCVAVSWFDENGMMLQPYDGVDPSLLRFEALVGHFSNYSIVAVVPEPASAVLFLIGMSMMFSRRRATIP